MVLTEDSYLTVDVSMSATGPIVHSFTEHFIQRWNFVKKNKYCLNDRFPLLPPSFGEATMLETIAPLARRVTDRLHLTHSPTEQSAGELPATSQSTGTYAQLVRSATKWSQGVEHEKSVQNAYIDLIKHATRKTLFTHF
jgi:phospholipase D1/2